MAKRQNKSRVGGHPQATSLRELARHCNRSLSAVRKWIPRRDWIFSRTGPWDVARVKEWMRVVLSPDPASDYRRRMREAREGGGEVADETPLNRAKIANYIERARLTSIRRKREEGELVPAAEAQALRSEMINVFRSNLEALGRSVSADLVGQPRDRIEEILNQRTHEILEAVAGEGRIVQD